MENLDDVARSNGAWTFHKTRAELCCGELTGQVDVSHPESGLNRLSIGTSQLSGHILAARPSSSEAPDPKQADRHTRDTSGLNVADSYVRGCDLVATYEPRDDWPYTTQIYWSAPVHETMEQRLGSLSLFVSLHTHLLDTWPRLSIESLLEADEAFYLADNAGAPGAMKPIGRGQHELQPTGKACCVLQRLVGVPVTYAEIMPASDFRKLTIRYISDGACQTSWELFADFLEKGVIRRARMQSVFVPRNNDQAIALALCKEIDQQQLPLTT
jgi:hypothetical protein